MTFTVLGKYDFLIWCDDYFMDVKSVCGSGRRPAGGEVRESLSRGELMSGIILEE